MTVPHDAFRRSGKSWMDEIKQELDRVMERERLLRAAIRDERLRRLDGHITATIAAAKTRRGRDAC